MWSVVFFGYNISLVLVCFGVNLLTREKEKIMKFKVKVLFEKKWMFVSGTKEELEIFFDIFQIERFALC
jgi:hypothetical protein